MGVYIKDVEIPESCPCVFVGDGYDLYCSFVYGIPKRVKEYDECCENGTRPDWCPLIEIPEPHGRLIDASEKIRVRLHDNEHEDWFTAEMTIDDLLGPGWIDAEAKTVIPASEEG